LLRWSLSSGGALRRPLARNDGIKNNWKFTGGYHEHPLQSRHDASRRHHRPLPSSRKIFVTPDAAADVRVPLREIMLSEGAGEPNLNVYDTSGPYTDPAVTIDVNAGLARNRIAWVKERGGCRGI